MNSLTWASSSVYDDGIKPFQPWDGLESVIEALTRSGMKVAFDLAIETGNRVEAVGFLVAAGVDQVTAVSIIAKTIPPGRADEASSN